MESNHPAANSEHDLQSRPAPYGSTSPFLSFSHCWLPRQDSNPPSRNATAGQACTGRINNPLHYRLCYSAPLLCPAHGHRAVCSGASSDRSGSADVSRRHSSSVVPSPLQDQHDGVYGAVLVCYFTLRRFSHASSHGVHGASGRVYGHKKSPWAFAQGLLSSYVCPVRARNPQKPQGKRIYGANYYLTNSDSCPSACYIALRINVSSSSTFQRRILSHTDCQKSRLESVIRSIWRHRKQFRQDCASFPAHDGVCNTVQCRLVAVDDDQQGTVLLRQYRQTRRGLYGQ
jgi:hypothetical protein